MNLLKKVTFFICYFICFFGYAQELPPVENFSAEIYGADNQNWSIDQSDEHYIYVANNKGLLEYNGEKWNLWQSPNKAIIRSVKVDGDRIYTGSYKEFGCWKKNNFGLLEYNSLSDKLDELLIDDENFWTILIFEDWVLFQSLNRIYIYNTIDETFNIINSETVLYKIFEIDRSIYFQKVADGIYKIERGKEVLVSNDPIFQDNILVNIYKIDSKTVFLTQDAGFFTLQNGKIETWESPINEVIKNQRVFSSIQLKNGNLILGTISNGMYKVDLKGNVIAAINQEKGLNNNTVLSLFEDKDQNLWLGLDNGISVVNLNSPFSVYNDISGNLGTVYASRLYDNTLYLGTNQGLFYKEFNTNDNFKFIEGTSGQVWSLEVFDDTLFCGHNTGTFIVKGDSVKLVCDVMGAWDFEPIENNPNLLIQGNYDGLYVLEKEGDTWGLRNKIEGFDNISCRQIYLNKSNQLFVNHGLMGLFKLILNDDYTKVYTKLIDQSAPKSLGSGIVNYNDALIYNSSSGIFKFNSSKDFFIKDTLLTNEVLLNDTYVSGRLIVDDETNTLWGFTNNSITYFTPGELSEDFKINKILIPKSLRFDISGYECMSRLNDQSYLFGTSRGYIILDLSKTKLLDFKLTLNTINKSTLNGEKMPVNLNEIGNFKTSENNLNFTYSVPVFDKYLIVNYQYKLDGMYNEWSEWSPSSSVSFENLSFGDYTLRVNARIGHNVSEDSIVYHFTINRPWYISNTLIVVYIVLFIVLIIVVHLLYKRYFNKQKQILLEKKQSEFTLSQLKSEKEIMNLKNEKLQNEIEGKTRELATSTMNIVKNNEFLNSLKNELANLKDTSSVKPIIKIIDKDMAKNSDWEMFQEAFNNADSDFLKKMKSVHPVLTPNDLRLCAYLRLNLSSKEIAPLLNISLRSVEIKRYRLRKKLNLDHKKSLVEYILEI
ncbi:triple tyrosine motif-containing protein [Formosa sp. PL04]|uniref:helix-turn-helix and ligand-binding sensor domain-containing protein n=1 Tax=Formosa sp. PL04 TaxID=3081755 RepID=UPI0029812E46|nr:triple tyrosine motif-containing protein [Formosa sp. PL04]MDW5287542.1 triple tyrosine motif-containing protein [Formosa sp. PL04]